MTPPPMPRLSPRVPATLRVIRFPFAGLDVTATESTPGTVDVVVVADGGQRVPLAELPGRVQDGLGRALATRLRVVEGEVVS